MSCTLQAPPETKTSAKAKQKPRKRAQPDNSQRLRRAVQLLFAALNVWIGVEFFLFVRHYETAGRTLRVERSP
ncbi:MAG: hypothetical protein GY953_15320, partial [bacterium]|nr:hypothetical protein [bacterium]